MGQSIERPKRHGSLRNSHSRSSARSLQRFSSSFRQQSSKNSRSASKKEEDHQQHNQKNASNYQNLNKNQDLQIMSNYEQKHLGIKGQNLLKNQKLSLGGQGSQLSPNFKQLNQVGAQYDLPHCPSNNNNQKPSTMQVSHHRDHHEITISFSKTKNHNNPFHDQSELKRENLKKILDDSVDHQKMNNSKNQLNRTANQYLQQEIERIFSTQSICSGDEGLKSENIDDKKISKIMQKSVKQQKFIMLQNNKQNQIKKQMRKQEAKHVNLQCKNEKQVVKKMNNTVSYNDYDLNSFANNSHSVDQSANLQDIRKSKLSQKMEELKAKIASKIVKDTKQKQSILKSCARRLSKSFQKDKSLNDSQDKYLQSFKAKHLMSKVVNNDQIILETSVNQQKKSLKRLKTQQNNKNDEYQLGNGHKGKNKQSDLNKHYKQYVKNSQLQQKQSNYTFKQPAKEKVREEPKKLIIFCGTNKFIYQNIIIQNSHLKPSKQKDNKKSLKSKNIQQQSFTQMVKKQHFSNKNKKNHHNNQINNQLKLSHAEHNKFSPVAHNFYASTCQQKVQTKNQYQFFDENNQKKQKSEAIDRLKKKQQLLSLKQITQKLSYKQNYIKTKGTQELKQSQNFSSSQEQSIRNKTFFQKNKSYNNINKCNVTDLNNTQLIGSYEEYMLKDALNRQKQGYEWAKNQRKKHKSLDSTGKVNGIKKGKLLVF